MHAASFRRAEAFLKERSSERLMLGVLGTAEALLSLSLLVVVGLMLALTTNPSHIHFRSPAVAPRTPGGPPESRALRRFPKAARQHAERVAEPDVWVLSDAGLTQTALRNLGSRWPTNRVWGMGLRGLIRLIPSLATSNRALFVLLCFGLFLIALMAFIVQMRVRLRAGLTVHVAAALRNLIHRQIYRLGQTALPAEGTGPVINLFTREVNDVRAGLDAQMAQSPRAWVLATGLFLIPLLISPLLAISLVALWGLVVLGSKSLLDDRKRRADLATREAAVQLSLLQEDLGLLRTVRVHGMEQVDKLRFDEHLERHSAGEKIRSTLEAIPDPAVFLLVGSAALLTFGWLSLNVLGERISESGALVMLVSMVAFLHPLRRIMHLKKALDQAARSASGIFEFLERRPEMQQSVGASFLPAIKSKISFQNVTVQSMRGRTLLQGVSFEIPAGTRTAIMGMDDEAKYALACMIPRLLDPKSGKVRVDGLDVREVTLESLRAQVSTVLQADLVFSDSVLANIGLGDTSFELPRIIEAAKIAHAHHFIQDLPNGYDTVIGPLGHYLSLDEQYRIALSRAYLHDPSIVIIEEPNIPLDDDTKHLFDDTISRLAPGRTMIFLPHRLSTIRHCEQVVVLHDGKVEAIGAPRDLQASSKLFRHLQYIEFNQFATGEIEVGQMVGH